MHALWLLAGVSCWGVTFAVIVFANGLPHFLWDFLDTAGIAFLLSLVGTLVVGSFAGRSQWPAGIKVVAVGSAIYGMLLVFLWFVGMFLIALNPP